MDIKVSIDLEKVLDEEYEGNISYLYLRKCYDLLNIPRFLEKYDVDIRLFEFLVYTDAIDGLQNDQDLYFYHPHFFNGPKFNTDDIGELEFIVNEHRKEYLIYLQKQMVQLFPEAKANIKAFKEYRHQDGLLPLLHITNQCVMTILYEDLEKNGYVYNAGKLKTVLRNMFMKNMMNKFYQAGYGDSYVLEALEKTYHLGLNKRNYTIEEIIEKLKRESL